jgi:AraC family transcriptional regulator
LNARHGSGEDPGIVPAMPNATAPPGPDRIVFETPLVSAGEFRCPVDDRCFEDTGPTRQYCFVFPRNACWIEQQGSPAFVADATVVPLYNQGHPYQRRAISPDGDRTDWFGVAPEMLREMVSTLDKRRADASDLLFPIPFVPATAATYLAQRYVFHHLRSEAPPDRLYVEEAVLTTLGDVLERAFGQLETPRGSLAHQQLVQRTREHLNRTYLDKESVTEVAAAVGASAFHLCRVFRRETGSSLHEYRTELRLRRSLEWLHDRADILSVALAAGFSHHSHFTAAFHRGFGVCPSDFRAAAAGAAGRLRAARS